MRPLTPSIFVMSSNHTLVHSVPPAFLFPAKQLKMVSVEDLPGQPRFRLPHPFPLSAGTSLGRPMAAPVPGHVCEAGTHQRARSAGDEVHALYPRVEVRVGVATD